LRYWAWNWRDITKIKRNWVPGGRITSYTDQSEGQRRRQATIQPLTQFIAKASLQTPGADV
jgi:hypothetical protein